MTRKMAPIELGAACWDKGGVESGFRAQTGFRYWLRAALLLALTALFCSCSGVRRKPTANSLDELLTSATKDSDNRVRAAAVRKLGAFKTPSAVTVLSVALQDPMDNVRIAAATSLGEIKDSAAVKPLCNALREPGQAPAFKLAAGRALAVLHDVCGLGPLIEGLRSVPPEVTDALVQLGDLAVPSLVEALQDSETRAAASDVLVLIGAAAIDPLVGILRDDEKEYARLEAARTLAEIGDERAEKALDDALQMPDMKLTAAAYRFLIRMGRPGTENRLSTALEIYGDLKMAEDFVASGNPVLKRAAEQWVRKNKYSLSLRSSQGDALHWGGVDSEVRRLGLYHYDDSLASTSGTVPTQSVSVSFVPGKWGSALSVGKGGILKYPLTGNLDFKEGTIEMWISPRFDGTNPIYQKYNHVLLLYHSPMDNQFLVSESTLGGFYAGSVIHHDFKGAGGGSISAWKAGDWHHIAFTYSARAVRQRFYIDGVMTMEQRVAMPAPDLGPGAFTVGCDPYGNWTGFVVDELQISGDEKSPYAIRKSASRKDSFAER